VIFLCEVRFLGPKCRGEGKVGRGGRDPRKWLPEGYAQVHSGMNAAYSQPLTLAPSYMSTILHSF